jgi:predicted Zn-dependent protease
VRACGASRQSDHRGRCGQALALSPRDPLSGIWYGYLGIAEFCRGRLDAAVEQLKRAIYSGYPTYITYALLAGAEAAKVNDAEAKLALAEARRLNPQLTIKWLMSETPTPPIVIDGLRKAGLPEE